MEAPSFSEVAIVCINHLNHCSCLVNEKMIISKMIMKVGSYKNVCYLVLNGKSDEIKKVLFNYLGF